MDVVNKICHQGFGTACVLDDGYYGKGSYLFRYLFILFNHKFSQNNQKNTLGIYFTTNLDYAMKYTEDGIVILSLLILGNSFPITEHPFEKDKNGKVIYEVLPQKIERVNKSKPNQNESKLKPKPSQDGYYGKPLQQGYQSHFTLGLFSFLSFLFFEKK